MTALSVLNVAYPFAAAGPDAVGGAEQILSAVEMAACDAGARSFVLACNGSQARSTLFPVEVPHGPLTEARRRALYSEYRERIDAIVERERIDLVHFHGVDFHEYLPRLEVPVLATLHLAPAAYPRSVFEMPRPLTYLNCVSDAQRRSCPEVPHLVEDVPNGVDLTRFRPAPKRGHFALLLARICPEKGIHLAIEAAQRAGLPLLIAGEVFPYPEHVRYFLDEVKPRLDAERIFLGPAGGARKAELLAQARCVLIPSLVSETSSLVAMEAMASGTPVVAFPSGALGSLVEPGRTGFLVADVEQMAEAMRASAALDTRECRAEAERRFSRDVMCRRYLDLYERLAERGRARSPGQPSAARERASDDIRVDEVRTLDALTALSDEWRALWHECRRATVFQRPEWLLPWCRHLLTGSLRVVTVRRAGRLLALAPFFTWQNGDHSVLSLLGARVSDYLDVVTRDDSENEACAALERWLERSDGFAACAFSEVPEGSPLLALRLGGPAQLDAADVCPGLDLAVPNVQDAVARHQWDKVLYARRRAERESRVRFEEPTPKTLPALLDALERLHGARWRERGEDGVLADPAIRRFQREASERLLAAGLLMLYALRLDERIAAVLYGFDEPRASRYYIGGFDPELARSSPGHLVIGHAIEAAHGRGRQHFDFLRGREPYKYSWGAADKIRVFTRGATRLTGA